MDVCPNCRRVDDARDRCGAHLTCGKANSVKFDPAKDALVECARCNVTMAIPAEEIAQNRVKRFCSAGVGGCQAVIVPHMKAGKGAK